MTEAQRGTLRALLSELRGEFHHGDAVGADAEAHDIAAALGCAIVIHPPAEARQRAFKPGPDIRPAKTYLIRNKNIVRETEMLIAAPAERIEQLRSGAWSTVRFARRLG